MARKRQINSDGNLANRRLIYGRQKGHRLHRNQARLVADLLPRLRPDLDGDGPAGWFAESKQDYALEIGFGGGEHLAARAMAAPHIGFVGCEPFINGVAKLLLAVEAQNLTNVAIHDDDARDVLDALPDASLGQAFLLYPDPWPKTRHHKRRFVNQDNLGQLFRVLRPGGSFLVASDIADYLDWTLVEMQNHGGFEWTAKAASDWHNPPVGWPGTRYEAKAIAAGRRPAYLQFCRRAEKQPGKL